MQATRWSEYSPHIWRLFVFTFIVGVATGVPEIIFNFYLASLGFDNAIAGQMVSLTRLSGFLFGIPLGLAVDRFGGIRVIQAISLVNLATWAVLLNTTDLTIIRICYFFAGVLFTAQATAILPLLSRITTPEQRPFVFGVNFALIMSTNSVSAILGGLLPSAFAWLQGIDATSVAAYRQSLASVFVFTILAVLSLTGLRRAMEGTAITDTAHADDSPHAVSIGRWLIAQRSLGRITLGFAGGMLHPFINLYLRQTYGLPDDQIGIIIAVYSFASVVAGLVSGAFIDRLGAQRVVVGAALGIASTMLLAFIPSPVVFVIAYTVSMFMIGQIYPAGDILILRTVPITQRGFTTSINNMFWSLGWAISAILSGWLQVHYGFQVSIVVHIIGMLLTAALFGFQQYPVSTSPKERTA